MSELNPEQFEAELQELRPSKPSQDSLERLLSKLPTERGSSAAGLTKRRSDHRVWNFLKWLIPAGAAAAVAFYLLPGQRDRQRAQPEPSSSKERLLQRKGPRSKPIM